MYRRSLPARNIIRCCPPTLVLMLLQASAMALGYGGYLVASHNGWIVATHGWRQVDAGVPPIPTVAEKELSLFAVGDTGKATPNRNRVVDAMRRHAARPQLDGVLLLGDNFYEHGVVSADDARFQTDFEGLFDSSSFPCPFFVCLGNHDYGGNVDAQVQYTGRSRRWKLHDTYYRVSEHAGSDAVDLFLLDTVPIHEQRASAQAQLAWLAKGLAESEARWKIVAGHHPLISGGRHDVSPQLVESLQPLFERYGVALYLSGHDHDLQLNDSGRGWLQVVSGAGAKVRSTRWIDNTIYSEAEPGFCWLLFSQGRLAITLYAADRPLYTHILESPARPQRKLRSHATKPS